MKHIIQSACGLLLCASLGIIASCGNGRQSTTDSTGTATDSVMSTTGANGNASSSALPGDTTTRPDSTLSDTSKSRRP